MSTPVHAHNARVCVAISTPIPFVANRDGRLILDTISPVWHRARSGLSHPTNLNMVEIVCDGQEVGVARNEVARRCLSHTPVPPEFLFFLDYDVIPHFDALTKLFFRARCFPQYDIFAGVYCCKHQNPPDPLIYKGNGQGPFWDWKVGDLLSSDQHGISAVHMGLTLIRVELFKKMLEHGIVQGDGTDVDNEPFFLTRYSKRAENGGLHTRSGTEDIYFCDKALEIGSKIMVDTSVLAGHYDKGSGQTFGLPWDDGPAGKAMWLIDRDGKPKDRAQAEKSGLKLCLDVGAGAMRRVWDGYTTYTTDIRQDVNPDYVQDTRMLNLPDNHFDMVATAHHLEHFGRFEQETIWKELYRICKPGGVFEFVLPNLEWAAAKIVQGDVDERAMDVLYGGQERHGYDRDLNVHYFGYTKHITEELAKLCGMENIVVHDYKEDERYTYELVLTATKPLVEAPNRSVFTEAPPDSGTAWEAPKAVITSVETTKPVVEMPVAKKRGKKAKPALQQHADVFNPKADKPANKKKATLRT